MFSLRRSSDAPQRQSPSAPPEAAVVRIEIAPAPSLPVEPSVAVLIDVVEIVDAIEAKDAVDATSAKPEARLTHAKTVEGSARSADGATSPWLLLPAERNYRLYVPRYVSQRNGGDTDRKSTRLNSSHPRLSRMPSSA